MLLHTNVVKSTWKMLFTFHGKEQTMIVQAESEAMAALCLPVGAENVRWIEKDGKPLTNSAESTKSKEDESR